MDLIEQANMTEEQELQHWWIRTRFLYIDKLFRRLHQADRKRCDVIEFGCGTGQNLRYLRSLSPYRQMIGRTLGIDSGFDGERRRDWMTAEDRLTTEWSGETQPFDVLLAMDVLEHIDDDVGALRRWIGALRPGAAVLLAVPAFQLLWSPHDVVMGHHRRYKKDSLRQLAESVGLETVRLTYAFGHLFPPVLLIRRLLQKDDKSDSDLKPHPPLVNRILTGMGRCEAALGGNPWFGTSVIGLFRVPRVEAV